MKLACAPKSKFENCYVSYSFSGKSRGANCSLKIFGEKLHLFYEIESETFNCRKDITYFSS